ncbi:hypothetical protein TCAL_13059, partial [Tigriopus californicus]
AIGKKSIQEGSYFSDSKLDLVQIISFIYCWARNWSIEDCSVEVDGISPNTQTDWGNFCRDICAEWLLRFIQKKLGAIPSTKMEIWCLLLWKSTSHSFFDASITVDDILKESGSLRD